MPVNNSTTLHIIADHPVVLHSSLSGTSESWGFLLIAYNTRDLAVILCSSYSVTSSVAILVTTPFKWTGYCSGIWIGSKLVLPDLVTSSK
jgi:hypothetical protein